MPEIDKTSKLNTLVNYFSKQGNFDHPDMEEVVRVGKKCGISEIDTGQAFFIAREKASLIESELLENGNSSESGKIHNYGPDSIHEMLFQNTSKNKK